MSKKLIVLIGKCAVGKSEVDKRLGGLGFNRCVSHTTRPPRPHEENGVDYHFITDEEYDSMLNQFLETTSYTIGDKLWRYGLHLDSIKEGVNTVVVNTDGLIQILNAKPQDVEVFVIWLKAPIVTTVTRYLNREGDSSAIRCSLIDRLIRDSRDFDNSFDMKLNEYLNKGVLKYWTSIDNSIDIDYKLDFITDYIIDLLAEFE